MIKIQGPVIAIDGPAGTGKSTVTRRLAENLGFVHIDTGALYRAIGLLALENELIDVEDLERLSKSGADDRVAARVTELARKTNLEFRRIQGRNPPNRVFANGSDVSDRIRTQEVSLAASIVSAISGVRAALLGIQRRLGSVGHTLLEGRDIGTVIFPDATIKFFLTASSDERARRRLSETEETGVRQMGIDEMKRQIELRDKGDASRKVAPLRKADDAIEVDTTHLSIDDVVKKMAVMIRKRLEVAGAPK